MSKTESTKYSVQSDLSGKLSLQRESLQHSNEVIIWTHTHTQPLTLSGEMKECKAEAAQSSLSWKNVRIKLPITIKRGADSPVTFANSSTICSFVLLLGMEPTNSLLLATEMHTPMCLPGRISLLLHCNNKKKKRKMVKLSSTCFD